MKQAIRSSEKPNKKQAQDNDTVETITVSIREVPAAAWQKLRVESVKRGVPMGTLLMMIVEELDL